MAQTRTGMNPVLMRRQALLAMMKISSRASLKLLDLLQANLTS
jgi:hypothetical protein